MFRNPNGKVLKGIFEHQVLHDLRNAPIEEKAYVFLLMSIAGNSSSPASGYGFNGAMKINFPDAEAAISVLRDRGYLLEPLPLDLIIAEAPAADLKTLLKAHGLPVSGKRDALVERLTPVLTAEEEAALRADHSFWLPSDLGYEMIYALYNLWEARQTAVLDALASHDPAQINDAAAYMPTGVGFWCDEYVSRDVYSCSQHLIGEAPSAGFAFNAVFGFRPEIFLHADVSR